MGKILIIEDAEGARNSIRRTLEVSGYEVVTANDGKEGLAIINSDPPDLIITDIVMPEVDGLQIIRSIARRKPDLPIIAITAYVGTHFMTVAKQFGARYGLYKPFDPDELLAVVQDAL